MHACCVYRVHALTVCVCILHCHGNRGKYNPSTKTPNPSTKTLQRKAMNLSHCILRASCDGCYFRSLNLLAWIDLSQQRCGSTMTAPFSYSDTTTFKSSAGVYISYTPALRCIWMIYALALRRYTPSALEHISSIYTSAP